MQSAENKLFNTILTDDEIEIYMENNLQKQYTLRCDKYEMITQ